MDELKLLISLKILEMSLSSLDPLLTMFEEFVALGLFVEVVAVVRDWRHELCDFWRGTIHTPENPGRGKLFWGLVGTTLIAAGVCGEVWVHVKSELLEVEMRDTTDLLVAKITKEAEDERMARFELEDSIAWRRLSDREISEIGQALEMFVGRSAYFTYPQGDLEADRFMRNIMRAVHKAKWEFLGSTSQIVMLSSVPAPNPTISMPVPAPPTGVNVRYKVEWSNPGESSPADRVRDNSLRRKAAEALTSELSKRGFDAVAIPDIPPEGSDIVVKVWYRPEGPQGAAKLRAEAKTKQAKSNQITSH